jgi:hypothetical protein
MLFQENFTIELSKISNENLFDYKPVLDTIFYQKSLEQTNRFKLSSIVSILDIISYNVHSLELTQFLRSALLNLNKTTLLFQENFTLEISKICIENLFGYKPVLDTIFYQKSLELTNRYKLFFRYRSNLIHSK